MVTTALKAKHYSKSIGLFYKRDVDITLRVSDCEELVGGYSQEMMGLFCKSDRIEII